MTKSQRFVLEWLSKEDASSYGECSGADLSALIELGYAKVGNDALGRGDDYRPVSVTDAGWAALVEQASA